MNTDKHSALLGCLAQSQPSRLHGLCKSMTEPLLVTGLITSADNVWNQGSMNSVTPASVYCPCGVSTTIPDIKNRILQICNKVELLIS